MSKQPVLTYSLSGHIANRQGESMKGLTVKAFDKDLLTPDDPLGQATTDDRGNYAISFQKSDISRQLPELFGPDLYVCVFADDQLVGESSIFWNAGEQTVIDVVVNLTVSDAKKPASRLNFDQVIKSRAALADNRGAISQSIFISSDEFPEAEIAVIPVEHNQANQKETRYEIRINLKNAKLGVRTTPPPLQGKFLEERFSEQQIQEYDKRFTAFIPDHLSFDPHPQKLVKAFNRIPDRLQKDLRYNTTIFNPDQRQVFQDTSYPWSAFGRCETNFGPFSGVMIGPRHLLTCNHGIDWTPPPGYAADWLTFTPAYFDGNAPFGSTYATHIYWVKKDNNDGFSNGDEGQYDYVVLVLNDRIGERTGWLGTRRYTDAWDSLAAWWHIGYPGDLNSQQRPTFQSWFTMNGHDDQDDAHQIFFHQADVFPGQSGGPMFGFWEGEVGPRAVAVQSWQNSTTNGASGGGDLVDLAIRARNEHP
ncbi:MAG: hypothetical protein R3C61_01225 [Bacteroidia bacterium]